MERFTTQTGTCVAIGLANIDTDQIIPKQFLKRIERTGYGEFLFYDWRYDAQGNENPDFVLNDPRYNDASILVAGANFGCGSSREHAPWSLLDHGFRVVIAPSFADIFYNNCLKTGILPVVLDEESVNALIKTIDSEPNYTLTVDLETQSATGSDGYRREFQIDPFRKYCLFNGLDDIALTLLHDGSITEFEEKRREELPFLVI